MQLSQSTFSFITHITQNPSQLWYPWSGTCTAVVSCTAVPPLHLWSLSLVSHLHTAAAQHRIQLYHGSEVATDVCALDLHSHTQRRATRTRVPYWRAVHVSALSSSCTCQAGRLRWELVWSSSTTGGAARLVAAHALAVVGRRRWGGGRRLSRRRRARVGRRAGAGWRGVEDRRGRDVVERRLVDHRRNPHLRVADRGI